ncbi:hypothetical protein Calab_0127 [Caldithrix abyssi DSM 13497]|uniref:Cna protein B-type domain protein n=1 Tax=Caldithrix abyssi DSM 13497 TaxID=880073 RepID=H1XXV7_CALAY|nr:hypothetical protein [Caldithrix abyssi]APF19664.1 Cna protein B-type domain protein [Caldithrix abyssi DSM 13497]EHO39780.1 hypothetical protein Calab_0127 [Caldithrix abyssi DSM 13497]
MFYLRGITLLLIFLGCITACFDKKSTNPQDDNIPRKTIQGTIKLPNDDLIKVKNLRIVHYLGEYPLEGNSFQMDVYASNKQQVFFVADLQNQPYLLGILDTTEIILNFSAASTAKALALITPFCWGTTYETRKLFLQKIELNPRYSQLVNLINQNLIEQKTLSLEQQPEVFQIAFLLAEEIYKSIIPQNKIERQDKDVPWIEGTTPVMKFFNPKTVYYGAGIYYIRNNGETNWEHPDKTALIEAKSGLIDFWNLSLMPPAETEVEVEIHQQYHVVLHKGTGIGLDLETWQSDTPQGIGARANVGQAILHIVDLIPGTIIPTSISFGGLANISIDVRDLKDLGMAAYEGDAWGFASKVAFIIGDNAEEIGLWLWEEGVRGAASSSEFWGLLGDVAGDVSLVGDLLDKGPFIYDLLTAPVVLYYDICISNNAFVECGTLNPPVANFTISPPSGDIGTAFVLDASTSTDMETPVDRLEVRWDIYNDGIFETNWSTNKIFRVSFEERGIKEIYLEVRDEDGLISNVIRKLNVSGGFASGKHILIFRDVLPWNNVRIEDFLNYHGYTEGSGLGEYSIHNSAEMASINLKPGYDFVIISNSQDQNFYNTYAQWNVKFSDFVYKGGSMLWEACDNGWYNNDPFNNIGGDMAVAGVVIPGNISNNFELDNYNYLTGISSPLTTGLPDPLFGNFASHQSFSHLPENAVIYTVNSYNNATLIEYQFGDGFMLVTGQPLEHAYFHGYSIGELLPRVVAYVLGVENQTTNTFRKKTPDQHPSSIPYSVTNRK